MQETEQEIPKTYNASDWETKLYERWEKSGYFNPDNLPGERSQTFCTIMPPPNANGRLHVGHGLDMTLKDLAIRFKRMSGYKTLWVPGADHAGFETQIVFEKKLEQEGRTRFEMAPQELYDSILKFTLENKQHMENDVRKLGASCDWSRLKFTLDENVVKEVQKTFKKMFDDGLVYRGSRIVNWCSKHQTALSDVETEFQEKNDPFYYFQFGPFVIGTARPETKFGDKYIVMHPDDTRYLNYTHGQTLELEWINGPITATVIKDKAIDMEFGTGVMTITPWHDPIDFDIAQKYSLSQEQVIDFNGNLLPIAQEFAGKNAIEARVAIVEKLRKKNLLVRVDETYQHNVKVCYKCDTNIEPQIKEQWFVTMKPLAEMAMKPVRDGKITFMPKRFEKIFFHWMTNTIDWNISRQIIWGIPIPAKICNECAQGFPDLEDAIQTCSLCQGTVRKDTDTFDTWFSSGQWPLLSLGYPDAQDFKDYYPTNLMETGADLVFKWVPRMIMFGMYLTGKEPFSKVYFHGMVNDEHNQKMSKSKGNVISPVALSEQFGTDAMRMSLIIGNGPGNNMPLSHQKVESYRNFTNKLWNIGRYVLTQSKKTVTSANIIDGTVATVDSVTELSLNASDTWILNRLSATIETVTAHLEKYQFSLAGETLRDFTWNEFADWYIEIHKIEKNDVVLRFVFENLLKLWHPFMPFITEALWSHLDKDDLLMIASWPTSHILHAVKALQKNDSQTPSATSLTFDFALIIQAITNIRITRAFYHIDPVIKIALTIQSSSSEETAFFQSQEALIKKLARIETLILLASEAPAPEQTAYTYVGETKLYIHLAGIIDIDKEKERLKKEQLETQKYIQRISSQLNNEHFVSKAPTHIINQNREELKKAEQKLIELQAHVNNLV